LPAFLFFTLQVKLFFLVALFSPKWLFCFVFAQSEEIGQIVKLLWGSPSSPGDPAVRQAFENRHKFQMDDSAA
jgi:hypothetical protein